MKNSALFYTAAFAFTSVIATAQVNQTPVHTGGGQVTVMREKSQPATGSMFINEKYMPAKISNDDKVVLARYNGYADNFEINDAQSGTTRALPMQRGVTITFNSNGESYTAEQYVTDNGDVKTGYLNIVSDMPNVKIYKREKITLQPERFPASSYQTYKPANYKKENDEFYIKIKEQDPQYFSNKKDIAKIIPSKSKDILNYIKKNKIDLDETADLQRLGTYVNGIL